jgi:nitroreductase
VANKQVEALQARTLSEVLKGHRSIRAFKPDPVPSEVVFEICDEAVSGGSSSGNLNSISIVLTREPDRKRRLYELHFEQEMVLGAPVVITFCADWFRTRQWLAKRGARDNFNNLIGYHVAAYDAIILAQNVSLGFEARGYGICYMGTTLHSLEAIADFLELPGTVLPVTTIVAGVPAENPAKRDRLPTSAFIHDERYHRPTDEELEAIYKDRDGLGWARYMSNPEFRAKIERLGITSLAQFYTSEAKYDPNEFARCSKDILAAMKGRSFFP